MLHKNSYTYLVNPTSVGGHLQCECLAGYGWVNESKTCEPCPVGQYGPYGPIRKDLKEDSDPDTGCYTCPNATQPQRYDLRDPPGGGSTFCQLCRDYTGPPDKYSEGRYYSAGNGANCTLCRANDGI